VRFLPGRVMGQMAGQQHAAAAALEARRQTEPRRSAAQIWRAGEREKGISREAAFGEA
jgi:hypothetical protein